MLEKIIEIFQYAEMIRHTSKKGMLNSGAKLDYQVIPASGASMSYDPPSIDLTFNIYGEEKIELFSMGSDEPPTYERLKSHNILLINGENVLRNGELSEEAQKYENMVNFIHSDLVDTFKDVESELGPIAAAKYKSKEERIQVVERVIQEDFPVGAEVRRKSLSAAQAKGYGGDYKQKIIVLGVEKQYDIYNFFIVGDKLKDYILTYHTGDNKPRKENLVSFEKGSPTDETYLKEIERLLIPPNKGAR